MGEIYEKIEFIDTVTGNTVCFYVLEQTVLNERTYLLVSDLPPDSDEANGYIFEAVGESGGDITYESVEDEETLDILSKVFDELLEDTVLEA